MNPDIKVILNVLIALFSTFASAAFLVRKVYGPSPVGQEKPKDITPKSDKAPLSSSEKTKFLGSLILHVLLRVLGFSSLLAYVGIYYFMFVEGLRLTPDAFSLLQFDDQIKLVLIGTSIPLGSVFLFFGRNPRMPQKYYVSDSKLIDQVEKIIANRDLGALVTLCEREGPDAVGEVLIKLCVFRPHIKGEILSLLLNDVERSLLSGRNFPRLRYYFYSRLARQDSEIKSKIDFVVRSLLESAQVKHVPKSRRQSIIDVSTRAFEIGLSSIILAMFTFVIPAIPFIISILLMTRSEGAGVFFVSRRRGQQGKEFNFYQFRAQRLDFQSNRQSIGRLGRALMWSGLDRLPSLLNVILGQMRFAGPHPLYDAQIGALALLYPDKLSMLTKRLTAKPGIFGAAQLNALISTNGSACLRDLALDATYSDSISTFTYLGTFFLAVIVWLTYLAPNAIITLIDPTPAKLLPPLSRAYITIPRKLLANISKIFRVDPEHLLGQAV